MKQIYIALVSSIFLCSCTCNCDEQQNQSKAESSLATLTEERAKEVVANSATSTDIGGDYFVTNVEEWTSGLQNMGDGEQWLFARVNMLYKERQNRTYHLKFIFKLIQNNWILCGISEGEGKGIPLAVHGWGEQLYVNCSE